MVAPEHAEQIAACREALAGLEERSRSLRGAVPAGNIVAEALALAAAAAQQPPAPFDIERVYELVGVKTGSSGVSVFADADAKIIGDAIDYSLRAIARPDQAAICTERARALLAAYDDLMFGGDRAAGALTDYAKRVSGASFSMAFGPKTYKGPKYKPLWKDDLAADGKDPKTSRKGHVEGW